MKRQSKNELVQRVIDSAQDVLTGDLKGEQLVDGLVVLWLDTIDALVDASDRVNAEKIMNTLLELRMDRGKSLQGSSVDARQLFARGVVGGHIGNAAP